jgi:hypothetical protein
MKVVLAVGHSKYSEAAIKEDPGYAAIRGKSAKPSTSS